MSDFRSSEIPNGSDLISRKTAIELIEDRFMKLKLSNFGTGTFRDGLADGYARVISDLKMLPSAQPEQRWIPIGSNPITTGLYLVLCNEWGKSMYRICAYYSEVGKWIENGKNITKSITHWMPLPEPWKGDKDA